MNNNIGALNIKWLSCGRENTRAVLFPSAGGKRVVFEAV